MSNESLRFAVQEAGRADQVVGSRFPSASRKRLAHLFREGLVRVDGKKVKKGHLCRVGQDVQLDRPPFSDEELRPLPEDVELAIAYEDESLLAIVKPAGMASHPLLVGELGSVANAVVGRFPECAGIGSDPREAGLAHRLDIDTSGLLLIARTDAVWETLRDAFAKGLVKKSYLAVVHERPIGQECEEPLMQQGRKVVIDYAGLEAHTTWVERSRSDDYTLLECQAHTGRMHQVRAHLAHCGAPIVGDELYGGRAQEGFSGHFLHAARLSLVHPLSGEALEIEAQLPADREHWLEAQKLRPSGD